MKKTQLTASAATGGYSVSWQGALRAVHGGDVSGKVPLQRFFERKNIYAVGPVAGLDGEITAIDGKFHIARVKHGEIKTDSDLSATASFLVWSEVSAWKPPVLLGKEVDNHAQLEKQIEFLALKGGVDTNKPFPFIIEGIIESVDYHILIPKKPHQPDSGHIDSAKKISSKDVAAKVIGFFSKNHEGIFTHRGSAAHLHILESNGYSGHVDEIVLNAEARVSFPQ
jgi:alpha-acetolactate decarboxylase